MFNEPQLATLRALVDRLIPPDDFPGGWEAGVGDYLAGLLAGDLRAQAERYRLGLDALDAEARAIAGQAFAELAPAAQDELLSSVERGEVRAEWSVEPTAFFADMAQRAAEGYYGDPGNGGNRGRASWAMIGFARQV